MAVWKCGECGAAVEARCKPGKCKSCGAIKDKLVKDESANTGEFSRVTFFITDIAIRPYKDNPWFCNRVFSSSETTSL
jgi:hypothetical protein